LLYLLRDLGDVLHQVLQSVLLPEFELYLLMQRLRGLLVETLVFLVLRANINLGTVRVPLLMVRVLDKSSLEREDIRALSSLHKQADLVVRLVLLIDDRLLRFDDGVLLRLGGVFQTIGAFAALDPALGLRLHSHSLGLWVDRDAETPLSSVVGALSRRGEAHVLVPALLLVLVSQLLLYKLFRRKVGLTVADAGVFED
jgi:hypothetical protein